MSGAPVLPGPVGVLGLGRVGRFLALGLAERGVDVRAWDRGDGVGLADVRARGVTADTGPLPAWLPGCGLLLVPVADRALEAVARDLGRLPLAPETVVLHTSGFHPAALLRPHLPAHVAVGSLHPVQAFPAEGVPRPAGIPAGIEGEPAAVAAAARLAEALGLRPFPVAAQHKALYHAALALAADGTVAVFAAATAVLRQAGVPAAEAQALLRRLLATAAANLTTLPPAAAATGPVRRGDEAVVRAHLEAVASEAPAEAELERAVVARLRRLTAEELP